MTSPTILLDWHDRVATITLNRPEQLNSFTAGMHHELRQALDHVERQHARALILTGAGRGFCAGQDLSELNFTPGQMTDLGTLIDEQFNPRALPLPVIAAVNGVAAGAGANLALACDIVMASENACFLQAFVKIGLLPDSGGTWFLPQRIGVARAMGLAMLGEKLDAKTALAWGLIWGVYHDSKILMTEVAAMADHLAKQPTRALAAIKRAMHAAPTQSLDAQLDLERDLQRELGNSRDYAEGVTAFLHKRPAHFTGE
jgi:2-(1,2-epoxy-1,2-dihydrophenyl)acetyl-CoA isomerase